MNNDNTLMIEALIQSRKPKKVLREGDEEFEDDYFSPGISIFRWSSSSYKVQFFPKPLNPEGIISHNSTERPHLGVVLDNKDIFWRTNWWQFNPDFGKLNQRTGAWSFNWNGVKNASGFIEGEDFIFVKRDIE